jgi:hypothetical protein
MKYIRVKNGVFAVNEEHGIKYIIFAKDYLVKYFCDSRHIIAEADTIEELCDEFVLYDKTFNTYGVFDKKVITYEWLKNHLAIYKEEWFIIYGAIWTSNGLIYVAKMNSEGKMVLI